MNALTDEWLRTWLEVAVRNMVPDIGANEDVNFYITMTNSKRFASLHAHFYPEFDKQAVRSLHIIDQHGTQSRFWRRESRRITTMLAKLIIQHHETLFAAISAVRREALIETNKQQKAFRL
jgi:hypothetical protein